MANSAAKILIVDDEERIRRLLKLYLEKEGYVTSEAEDGPSALKKILEEDFDLILLDIMLPGMTGLEIMERVRLVKDVPVMMITARGEENHRVEGLQAGVDDYIVKPFSPREAMLRVAAILKRTRTEEPEVNVLSFPALEIMPDARVVIAEGDSITLTPKEFDLLLFLARHPERIFTRESLLREVWRYDYFGDLRTVDTHVKRLREKLHRKSNRVARMIVTVWGTGYKFSPLEGIAAPDDTHTD